MLRIKNLAVMLLASLLFVACESSTETNDEFDQQALQDEIMAAHDEVMPKMGELNKLKNELMEEAKALTEEGQEEAAERLTALATELEDASKSMMDWMRQYKPQFDGKTKEEIQSYLNDQKEKVEVVRNKINGGIETAKTEIQGFLKRDEE